jgi:hypothetical protein
MKKIILLSTILFACGSTAEPQVGTVIEALTDGGDAGLGATITQYAHDYAAAFCSGQGKCCPGFPGNFDQASCTNAWQTVGWEFTLPETTTPYTAGHLAFNATRGAKCITALQNFACTTGGTVTAAQYDAVTDACQRVLTGTIAVGGVGCTSSFECNAGWCNAGTCQALVGRTNVCAPNANPNASPDEQCSQAGSYQPQQWCNRLAGGATGTCRVPLANGRVCYNPAVSTTYFDDYGCGSLLCGDNGLCGSSAMYPTAGFCSNWATTDGG